ncbi:hypothetical protein [Deinococcus roseus]|uniref:Secreted protein n=1 Tax=Deinococcus roseus TaxID=392414 RepID=A0ABQ2D4L6_9DEIO|nr:hypothetical protein [Deinococcus roseus]GGJ39247.1 hypothetical protein GCM10008938_26610 [Deinococcus roseus]
MKNILLTTLISAISLTGAAGAASVSSASNLGPDYHLITSATGQCTGTENCTIPYGEKVCNADTLGLVYRMTTPNNNGTYSYEDIKCVWGDDSWYVVNTYTVTKGGEDFSCPIVAQGPFTSTTSVWPPVRFWGLDAEEFVYCDRSK